MELQIGDLVASIRQEAIEKAREESERIISEADAKAAAIVSEAQKRASQVEEEAQREVSVLRSNASESVAQAVRDAVLSFKAQLSSIYDSILSHKIAETLDDRAVASLVKAAVDGRDVSKLTVETSQVSDMLKAQLADLIVQGLEIRPVKGMKGGFRLCEKDGSGYYDFSSDALQEALRPFLSGLDV